MSRATLVSALALLALSALALLTGEVAVAPADFFSSEILWQLRAPRVGAALLVGAALAAAGTAYQGMFRNPLVSPDILGVSAGAAAGAVLAMLLCEHPLAVQGAAFAGGIAAVALAYAVAAAARGHEPGLALVLSGVVVGSLLASVVALLKVFADPFNQLPPITYWLLGGVSAVTPRDLALAAPLIALGLAPLVLLRWRMNLLALPQDEARSLGVPVGRMRLAVVAAATLMTAAAVAIAGIVGWVGLVVPHAARMLVGPGFARLLPLAVVLGAGFFLAVDTACRAATAVELPPGVVTALVGTPVFLALLLRARSAWQ